MPTVSCPSCGRALEVDDAYRDWTVRCPHCATEFVPAEVAPAPFDVADRRGGYDDYDRPRRRGRDPERDEWERDEAVHLVHGPGTWLEVCGWLGGVLLAGGAVYWFAIAATAQQNNGDAAVAVVMGAIAALLALPYTIVMVVGGRKMRALSGYGWAMTASVTAIASIVLICFMCVCSIVPVGFGIWGVVALSNPLVCRAFETTARRARAGWE